MDNQEYCIEYDLFGRAACKKCAVKFQKGSIRIGKIFENPLKSEGTMKRFFHIGCLLDSLLNCQTNKKLPSIHEIQGFCQLKEPDRIEVMKIFEAYQKRTKPQKFNQSHEETECRKNIQNFKLFQTERKNPVFNQDTSFQEFRRLCNKIAEEECLIKKIKTISSYFSDGSNGNSFTGDMHLFIRMLFPTISSKPYNLDDNQLLKYFSQIFETSLEEMMFNMEQGGNTEQILKIYFEQSLVCPPAERCTLTIQEANTYLCQLLNSVSPEEQKKILKQIAQQCTADDLVLIIRLIKGDLKLGVGINDIRGCFHSDAINVSTAENFDTKSKSPINTKLVPMKPFHPMSAKTCNSIAEVMENSPHGMIAEMIYNGERIQVHKAGNHIRFFNKNLQPINTEQMQEMEDFILQGFRSSESLVLDSIQVLIDGNTRKTLPYTMLEHHENHGFQDAYLCLFVFDCLHYNGKDMTTRSLKERKVLLLDIMINIPFRVINSEVKMIRNVEELKNALKQAKDEGLEGLILKDIESVYEPGQRQWKKVKLNHLQRSTKITGPFNLIVLGAFDDDVDDEFKATPSTLLLGCHDPFRKWCTVAKVKVGSDLVKQVHTEVPMMKIKRNPSLIPSWLNVSKCMIPDYVIYHPKDSLVLQITGDELIKNDFHTADGISIASPQVIFPRARMNWNETIILSDLKAHYVNSQRFNCKDKFQNWSDILNFNSAMDTDD